MLFEARHVPWFAGGYHGTFWIFGLKPYGLFPISVCLRPGASHGLRAATMERSGFSKLQSDLFINQKFQSDLSQKDTTLQLYLFRLILMHNAS